MPRSAIIWPRSRELSLNVRYRLMHRTMISWSKCRPLKRSCAEVGSVIPAVTAGSQAFQVCTRTTEDIWQHPDVRQINLMSGGRFPGRPEFLDYQYQNQSGTGGNNQTVEKIEVGEERSLLI